MIHEIKIEFVDGRPPHKFKLGLGPCGRVATDLTMNETATSFEVRQWVEGGGEPATFHYPRRGVLRAAKYEYDPAVCPVQSNG